MTIVRNFAGLGTGIDASGNVGIGVVPSAWSGYNALQFDGGAIASYGAANNYQVEILDNAYATSAGAFKYTNTSTNGAGRYQLANAGHAWYIAPSGTAGAAITFTQAMTLDASGNVGIGNTSIPTVGSTTVLAVGNANGGTHAIVQSGSIVYRTSASSSGVDIYNPIASPMQWYTSGLARMMLDASGNLGLGVTPSAWGSSFKSLDIGAYASFWNTSGGTIGVAYNAYHNGTNFLYRSSGTQAANYQQSLGVHSWYTAPSGTAGAAITFTQAMTLDANGNLGIGTASPASKLDIYGSNIVARAYDSSTGYALFIAKNNSQNFRMGVDNSLGNISGTPYAAFFGNDAAYPMTFLTNSAERMRLDVSGNLLVGTTTRGSTEKLAIQAVGANDGIFVRSPTGGSGYVYSVSQATGIAAYFLTPSGQAGLISVSGVTTSYTSGSDYRLKDNIRPLENALAKVAAMRPVAFEWKCDGKYSESFIAHELAEVCAQAVVGEKDAVDAEGKPKYQGIDTSFLIATLTAAIQEQQAVIVNLTDRITALETK